MYIVHSSLLTPAIVASHFVTHSLSNVYKHIKSECGAAGDPIKTVIAFETSTKLHLMLTRTQFVNFIAIVSLTF